MSYEKGYVKPKIEKKRLVRNILDGEVFFAISKNIDLDDVLNANGVNMFFNNQSYITTKTTKKLSEKIGVDVSFLGRESQNNEMFSYAHDETPLGTHSIKGVYIEKYDNKKSEFAKKFAKKRKRKQAKVLEDKQKEFREIKYGRVIKGKT